MSTRLLWIHWLALLGLGVQGIVYAGPPAVQGPEAVEDWRATGQAFMQETRAMKPIAGQAKNVILFVGDGMGVTTLTASRILEGQMQGKSGEENRLSFERFPYVALSKTYSWDQQTSDSAPTMSAMVTGYKTREGMLSVDHLTPRGMCDAEQVAKHQKTTLLERAASAGKATGIVSTARLTHATPAATYAHTPLRDFESDALAPKGKQCSLKDIARQFVEVSEPVKKSLRVALAGGRSHFLPETIKDPETQAKGKRKDGRNLVQDWLNSRGSGAQYVWNAQQFAAIQPRSTPYLLGLFEPSHMQYALDRSKDRAGEPSLSEMTEKAIQILSQQPNGYFLMVEAGRIDHAHHAGNAKRALTETIALSDAVKLARKMTNVNDTLIIVTADHSHTFTMAGYPHRGNPVLGLVADVPNEDGLAVEVSKDKRGLPYTTLGYANGPGWAAHAKHHETPLLSEETSADEFLQEAAIPLESETHGGEDVAIFASGPQAHLVHGVMEQHWLFDVMLEAFGFR